MSKLSRNSTPLERACQLHNSNLVQVLIGGGADVKLSTKDKSKISLLTVALKRVDNNDKVTEQMAIELIQVLLNAGAEVNLGFGESPLKLAAEAGHVEAFRILISAGADVNYMYSEDNYSLLTAVLMWDMHIPNEVVMNIVRSLLQQGADLNFISHRNGGYFTALEAAMQRQSFEIIKLLVDHGARITNEAFVKAARFCDLNISKLLINLGASVTEAVIKEAVEHGEPELVWFLLDAAKSSIR
jgi:ankyrin repeat protein